jgi:hypothetical protein
MWVKPSGTVMVVPVPSKTVSTALLLLLLLLLLQGSLAISPLPPASLSTTPARSPRTAR